MRAQSRRSSPADDVTKSLSHQDSRELLTDAQTPTHGEGGRNEFLEALRAEVQVEFSIHSIDDITTSCCRITAHAVVLKIFPDAGIFTGLSRPVLPFQKLQSPQRWLQRKSPGPMWVQSRHHAVSSIRKPSILSEVSATHGA